MTTSILTEFPRIPASKLSLSQRKPIYGVGCNDADYLVTSRARGKQRNCPFYAIWKNMFQRCYDPAYAIKYPTYADATVTPEWYNFMTFRAWVVGQDWQGNCLDKDLLIPRNKISAPDRCLFVSNTINTLLSDNAAQRGKYPIGVILCKDRSHRRKPFRAEIRLGRDGSGRISRYLGHFRTPEEASAVYRAAKSDHIREVATAETEPLRSALLRHADLILNKASLLGLCA